MQCLKEKGSAAGYVTSSRESGKSYETGSAPSVRSIGRSMVMSNEGLGERVPHVDDVTKREAQQGEVNVARDDDGTLYNVKVSDWDGSPLFYRRRTEEEWAAREGAGEPCEACGEEIPIKGIILRDKTGDSTEYYHVACYKEEQ